MLIVDNIEHCFLPNMLSTLNKVVIIIIIIIIIIKPLLSNHPLKTHPALNCIKYLIDLPAESGQSDSILQLRQLF